MNRLTPKAMKGIGLEYVKEYDVLFRIQSTHEPA